MNNQDIINAVDPIAQQYGVPTRVWETVVQEESSFNPNAVGDNGTSFGLFQLHQGGQLPQGMTQAQASDPVTNAKVAMPAIAKAWRDWSWSFAGGGSGTFWDMFAIDSGHPGGFPGNQATENEARDLNAIYNSNTKFQGGTPGNTNGVTTPGNTADSINSQGAIPLTPDGFNTLITNAISSVTAPFVGGFAKVGIFLFACIILIAGFYIITREGMQ